ncbi:ATP-dependent DNA helicase [Sphingorhabdus pulchriflava]|uniref:ATP-dependent DNA helicase n=1 Tax=Sphingorhabdus pulchriflava TaxID=2292257 RepID=A0A371BJL9_9SPHN|nr:ATP-dependent DNA helicase [Sphingorhabdus pulchriflava]RDV07770.1 ATP-dependent DNA helicase [Sphingorhabdus pulchriflava]
MAPPLAFPALHASHAGIWIASSNGETRRVGKAEAVARAAETPMILLNAPLVAQRLGYAELSGLDLLELFAFVHPARFVVPTAKGLSELLGLGEPAGDEAIAGLLLTATQKLLATLTDPAWPEREGAWDAAQALARLRWPWARVVADQLPKPEQKERWLFSKLPEWEEAPLRTPPRSVVLDRAAVETQLARLTGSGAEIREGQRAFAASAAHIFDPRARKGEPNMLLAEAGTGIGKTLGYLAPASLWAQEADGAVWISTYTKALQRQLVSEARRVYPDAQQFKEKVVVRKGRENYLCLLNLEDALQGGFAGRAAILAHLVARWAAYTADGDMIGGDLPGWLPTLFRRNGSTALTDRRGECIYAGCPHYRKCFIECASRASAQADIVIANHALMMVNAARGREEANRPTRIIFDEGHHLFDAADSTFAAALTGAEMIEIRRWIIGPEGKARGRRRGLSARLADVASYDEEGGLAIEAAREAAEALPGDGWLGRVNEGVPSGPAERLLAAVRTTVYARDEGQAESGYGLETEYANLDAHLIEAIADLMKTLEALVKPLMVLGQRLEAIVEDAPDWLDAAARARIEGAMASLGWRVDTLRGWIALLGRGGGPADPDFVDWLAVDRGEGREYDIGIHRHWLDPTRPVSSVVLKPAHGILTTSATLRSGGDWGTAEARTGAAHLEHKVEHFSAPSPFDYASQAEVLVVTDIARGDMPALAGAYSALISASQGGALGLFTAIKRLRSVHARIADRLARDGLPLYAQHVDPMDTGTLVDIFRDDPHASLLGTDALRDGMDVPGHSLRLVIMEQVPWPRPDILHKARRLMGGGTEYDDRIIRARLAQAFGRLIRKADDKGHFVLLSSATPSRLLTAFPAGTPIHRVTLDEAVRRIKSGLSPATNFGQGSAQEIEDEDIPF